MPRNQTRGFPVGTDVSDGAWPRIPGVPDSLTVTSIEVSPAATWFASGFMDPYSPGPEDDPLAAEFGRSGGPGGPGQSGFA